jgi:biopolymer transport protein ExbD
MKLIRKKKKGSGAYSSSSMSDIVFMLLFFFMVTTTMREEEINVKIQLPEATEIAKLERKDLTCYINVGAPNDERRYGTDTRMQLNDKFSTVDDIRDFVAAKREQLSEADRVLLTVAFKIDRETRMGIVTDVKQELRRCQALKISYLANTPSK